ATPRFREFAERQRDKMRKKRRNLGDDDAGLCDLLCELGVGCRLLRDKRITLEYEAYAAAKARGPDFTATFKGHVVFNVEVTRIRSTLPSPAKAQTRLIEETGEKLRQFPPAAINILVIALTNAPSGGLTAAHLTQAMETLRRHAQGKDEPFLKARGLHGSEEYFALAPRLSAAIAAIPSADPLDTPNARLALWVNPQAKHPLVADTRGVFA
ncbi:MAG TPA: hypothetical protein VMV29_22655, partial [Ktedonobacterales bacterium]|nr:hypothetical protein [Ktedonobacterales bacterium]